MKKIYLLTLSFLLSSGSLSVISAYNLFPHLIGFESHNRLEIEVNPENTMTELYEEIATKLTKKLEAPVSPDQFKVFIRGHKIDQTDTKTVAEYKLEQIGTFHIVNIVK